VRVSSPAKIKHATPVVVAHFQDLLEKAGRGRDIFLHLDEVRGLSCLL
jgi:hypothetical protein